MIYLKHRGRSRVVLYPDAGAVLNDLVLTAYYKTIPSGAARRCALVESWGKEVKVAWWGKLKKEDGDIDEILQKDLEDCLTCDRLILYHPKRDGEYFE